MSVWKPGSKKPVRTIKLGGGDWRDPILLPGRDRIFCQKCGENVGSVWSLSTGKRVATWTFGDNESVTALIPLDRDRRLLAAYFEPRVAVFETKTGAEIGTLHLDALADGCRRLAISANGKVIVGATQRGVLLKLAVR